MAWMLHFVASNHWYMLTLVRNCATGDSPYIIQMLKIEKTFVF